MPDHSARRGSPTVAFDPIKRLDLAKNENTRSASRDSSPLMTLYRLLPPARRVHLWATIGLMIVGALAEVVSVGAVLPFLAVLTNPGKLDTIPVVGGLISSLPPGSNLVAITASTFISLVIVSGLIRLALAWASQSLAFSIAYDLSVIAFAKLIRQTYPYYVARHSGEVLSQFEKLHAITFTILLSGSQAVISTVVAIMLIAFLVAVNPAVAIVSAALLVGTYLLISVGARAILRRNSEAASLHATLRIKRVQEALGGIRDILLDHSQPAFERSFIFSADRFRHVSAINSFITLSPRIVIEMLGMVMIGAYAWLLANRQGGVAAAIPMLGAMALGAQRLLPLLQQSYAGWSSFVGNRQQVYDVLELLMLEECASPTSPTEREVFNSSIRFAKVGFAYSVGGQILHEIDFTIRKGERIGIAGTTGSGKSTLMDLLLGLLQPTEGEILIDGRLLDEKLRVGWQAKIAHVPQAIYLIDDTIAANIAFGVSEDEVDEVRVAEAARSAGIADFIATLPGGYGSRIGERGIRLSGGQRQRIGIARALYKRASVLVFDEATSALDTRTEEGIMKSVAGLARDITIVMIAHRLTTLKDCDRVIHLEAGRIERIVTRS